MQCNYPKTRLTFDCFFIWIQKMVETIVKFSTLLQHFWNNSRIREFLSESVLNYRKDNQKVSCTKGQPTSYSFEKVIQCFRWIFCRHFIKMAEVGIYLTEKTKLVAWNLKTERARARAANHHSPVNKWRRKIKTNQTIDKTENLKTFTYFLSGLCMSKTTKM